MSHLLDNCFECSQPQLDLEKSSLGPELVPVDVASLQLPLSLLHELEARPAVHHAVVVEANTISCERIEAIKGCEQSRKVRRKNTPNMLLDNTFPFHYR